MAEFSEVSQEYIRMCESFGETCEGCPISACSGNDIYVCRNIVLKNPEKYEDTIMKWATEHTIIYPTWYEYLTSIGVVFGVGTTVYDCIYCKHIPADIAEKLGIEPKEGT